MDQNYESKDQLMSLSEAHFHFLERITDYSKIVLLFKPSARDKDVLMPHKGIAFTVKQAK